VAEWLKAALC